MMRPVPMEWTGEVLRPPGRYLSQCARQFQVGSVYPMVIHEERSTKSHNHYFAAVHEAWKNLPEAMTKKYPTSEHLRKWALIKANYADERSIVCDSNAEALRVASFIKPMDDFAVVIVRDDVIKVYTAKSQSARSMDRKTFQDSKTAVLEIVSEMIGVDASTLSKNTNSSEPPQAPPADAQTDQPAAEASASAAGQQSASSPTEAGHADGEGAVTPSPSLPQGTLILYAAALRRAQKKESLAKYAKQFWDQHDGWEKWQNTPDGESAAAIFNIFRDNFGNKDVIELQLREII